DGDDGRKVVATRRAAVKIVQGEIAEKQAEVKDLHAPSATARCHS
ncbi:MAG: hypothetical protein QG661_2644, partial [Actinomycetota bacterium]|nr:hypothetical protein [Actinomycetota bacterium]